MQAVLAATLIASFQPAAASVPGACDGHLYHRAAYVAAAPAPCCRIGQGCARFLSTDTIIRGRAWSKT